MTNTEIYLVEPEERTSPFPPSFWERRLESLKEIASSLLCMLFQKHSWLIEVKEWEYSEISTLDEYRNKRASHLKCKHCSGVRHVNDANLTHYELVCYKWQTSILYEYFS